MINIKGRGLLCAAAALLLAPGCAHITGASGEGVLANPSSLEAANRLIPAGWDTATSPEFTANIKWTDFDDPVLQGLIRSGLDDNLSLAASLLRLQSAEIALDQANTRTRPSLSLGRSSASLSQSRTGSVNESYSFGGSAAYQVDLWGLIDNDIQRSRLSYEDRLTALRAARISTAQRIALTYFDIRVQDELIRLQRRQIEIQRDSLRLSRVRLQAGAITRLSVDQIDVNIQQLLSNLESQIAERTNQERALGILLGKAPGDFTLAPAPFSFLKIPRLNIETPASVLAQRPDIERAERSVISADISLDTARKAWLPGLGLGANAGQSGFSIADFLTADGIAASLTGSFSALLYDNGNRGRAVSQSILSREQAVNAYQQAILSALQDVERVLTQQAQNTRQIEIQSLQQEAQESVTRITQAQYDTGAASAFDLVREQQNALRSRQSRIRNWQAGMRTSLGLLAALGVEPKL